MPRSTASADSVINHIKENAMLKVTIDSMKVACEKDRMAVTKEEIERSKAISNLKQLKELLDAIVMTEAEFLPEKMNYLDKL